MNKKCIFILLFSMYREILTEISTKFINFKKFCFVVHPKTEHNEQSQIVHIIISF